ncbi:histone-lysine N-methyltransferase SETDB1-like isoform X2 [Mixophyes fleayi]|uniref:histone-lysine N-methyltransferase SETDB1-like isoform X2 n=1 Tax=Mixophyes fleayi TaxID=3061075 RepID=UPI003F4D9D36
MEEPEKMELENMVVEKLGISMQELPKFIDREVEKNEFVIQQKAQLLELEHLVKQKEEEVAHVGNLCGNTASYSSDSKQAQSKKQVAKKSTSFRPGSVGSGQSSLTPSKQPPGLRPILPNQPIQTLQPIQTIQGIQTIQTIRQIHTMQPNHTIQAIEVAQTNRFVTTAQQLHLIPTNQIPDENSYKAPMEKLFYLPHICSHSCLSHIRAIQHRGKNPLLVPLLFDFRRMKARRFVNRKMGFHVIYKTPCGLSLRSMPEIERFLFETNCDLFLEMFCLDPYVLLDLKFQPQKPFYYIPDITYGKEDVQVSCVNEIDRTPPPQVDYSKERVPGRGVFINTDLDFLVGCDCTDGCRDRSKCACHQLTIDATRCTPGAQVNTAAGYTHKRLEECLPTGVYECNKRCKCNINMCTNRLVQHGLQVRLQLFKTQNKGWGIRCLDDIAKGSFVCIYVGKILTDDFADKVGLQMDDEYFANLDYIESVENYKEGYESDVKSSSVSRSVDLKEDREENAGRDEQEESNDESSDDNFGNYVTIQDNLETDEAGKFPGLGNCRRVYSYNPSPVLPHGVKRPFSKTAMHQMRRQSNAQTSDVLTLSSSSDCEVENGADSKKPAGQINANDSDDIQTISSGSDVEEDKKSVTSATGPVKRQVAVKSTHDFPLKSTYRLKPTMPSADKGDAGLGQRTTRQFYDGEESCYIIDAKLEGNLGRYLNSWRLLDA